MRGGIGTLLLDNDKNNIIVDKNFFLLFPGKNN